ncbi:MAG: hypothetical protein QOF27_2163 [Gaiellaceae bacterium]|nr:hypothetical protein [Gaiellaceae bacterium]
MRGIAVLLVVVGALSALGFARHEQRIREQDQLASIASDLAGRKVAVRCPSFLAGLVDVRGEAGRVQFDESGRPANHTDLSPETCKALRHLDRVDFGCLERGDCGLSQFAAGWAAHTLAHEAFHLRGFQDEGVTECYALQNTAYVAERLGVPTRQAEVIQAWLFKRGYPNEPTEYQSSGCHDGGPLDLRPQQSRFP